MPSVRSKKSGATPGETVKATAGKETAAVFDDRQSGSQKTQPPQLIVSLTSYHKRFGSLLRTLATLDNQELAEDYCIHVHLSEVDMKKIPVYRTVFDELEQSSHRIQFHYHEENIRSYKKFYYSLMKYPNATVVTTDDDVLYPVNWLSGLVGTHRQTPDCIVCYRGHYLESKHGRFKKYLGMMFSRKPCSEPSLWLLPTGVSGVLYPPGSLDMELALDRAGFMELAPKADDFWLKLASLAKGTKCVRVNTHNTRFPHVPFTQFDALTWHNAALGDNDRVLQAISRRYPGIFDVLHKPASISSGSTTEERCL